MELSLEKQKKLAYVARRYYLNDQKQSDIAQELGEIGRASCRERV